MKQVNFTRMDAGTREEYQLLSDLERDYIDALPDRVIAGLKLLGNSMQGYRVSRFEHSLQTATRAEADGADIEMVVAALIHDIGDDLAPANHSEMAAAIIRPYVRAEVTWVVAMHGTFQLYYYGDKLDLDRDARERHRGHQWFGTCERFCERWDQMSFDPAYPSKPLSHFEPMVREIFTRRAFDPAVVQRDEP